MQRNELAKLRLDNELKASRIAELERSLGGGSVDRVPAAPVWLRSKPRARLLRG